MENSITDTGVLVVVLGQSGAGKDTVIEEVLKHPSIKAIGLRRLITCADRPPRPDETQGNPYFFVSPEEMDAMHKNRELVEKPLLYGTSRKATPKKEFTNILKGENLLWRIESYLGAKVALGTFFDEQFTRAEAEVFRKITKVICITSPKEQIEGRRKSRDGDKYNPKEYKIRDKHDQKNFSIFIDKITTITNLDGKLTEAVNETVSVTLDHHAKIKNKKP